MAQSTPVLDKTFLAAGDLSAAQWTAVVLSAEYTVTTGGANSVAIGVQQDVPAAAGRGCRVRMLGTSKAKAGGAFAAGARLAVGTGGKFVTASAGENSPAIALQAATADLDIVEVFLTPGGLVAT